MQKDVVPLIDTLKASVNEIALSGADNREDLLTRSFTEFQDTLLRKMDERYGADPEPLAKGLNHISAFASALNRMNQTVTAIKTGRPSYMVDSDSGSPPEILPAELAIGLDHFMAVGIFALREMVNNSVELPETEEELAQAEKAGELVKIEGGSDGEDLMLRSTLPETLRGHITHPLDLMIDAADLGRTMMKIAGDHAQALLDAEMVPADVIQEYPDLFEVQDEMGKAFPPAKKKPGEADPPAARARAPAPGTDDGSATDEADGTGAADQGAGLETGDVTDDTPQDPLEILARLATIMVVITGSLLQGQGGDPTGAAAGGDQTGATMPPGAAATPPVGLQRGTPIETTPLAKIMGGEVEVDPTLADALVELEDLRKKAPDLEKKLTTTNTELELLKIKVAELSGQPTQPKGVLSQPALGKGEEVTAGTAIDVIAQRLEKMRKDNPEGDGGEASKLLIGAVHSGGGRPFAPLGG